MKDYQTYKNLPPIAGLATFEEAMKPGLTVDQCVVRLKRYHYVLKRLYQIFTARLTGEPIYELKMAFSLHSHYCAEHVTSLRKRVSEMREPPLGMDVVPDSNLEILMDEVLSSPSTEELLLGLYDVVLPALLSSFEQHMRDTHPLADHPSIRVCRFAALELKEMVEYGAKAVAVLLDSDDRARHQPWVQSLRDALSAAGGISGVEPIPGKSTAVRYYSLTPYHYDGKPRRDERFSDPYNMGVNAEVFLYDEAYDPEPKTLMMFYKRLREIDVPEMMASILTETKDKPWDYYRDMTRQLWDEARHAMMGEIGFINAGVDWRKVMVNFTWSMALNTQLKPIERHAVLYFIEQGLMPRTGKRFEFEVGQASKNRMAALFQDYDWADEVLHAKIGRDWYLKDFKNAAEATKYGDECWSKVLMDWGEWKRQGLTQHRNWWPEVYMAACRTWGKEPDPKVLAYNTTYESVRADLKAISASG